MIFPIPQSEKYSEGRFAAPSDLASLSLVDLFSAVKDGAAGAALSLDASLSGEAHKISISSEGIKIAYATEEGHTAHTCRHGRWDSPPYPLHACPCL